MRRFERMFKLWDYHITHSRLLIRSHKTISHPKNIDIMFFDVDYVELPTILPHLEIVEASAEERSRAEQVMARPVAAERVFVIASQARRYLIVAGGMRISENELELLASSLEGI